MPSIPFTGRQAEQDFLRKQLQLAREQGTRLVLITTPAGMGKTALVRHFLDSIKDSCVCAEGRGWDNRAAVPYHALREAVLRLPQPSPSRESPYLDVFLEGEGSQETGNLPPDLLFRSLGRFLSQCNRPFCLFLDDLQWADEGTFEWLDFALHELQELPLLLLGACRSEEQENIRPFLSRSEQWIREGRFCRCELGPLSQEEVETLVQQAIPSQDWQEDLADRIWQRSEGIALWAVEEIGAYLEGSSGESAGDALIRYRIECLSKSDRELLNQAAVIGERFSMEPLVAALGKEPLEIAHRLAALSSNGFLLAEEDGYSFVHSRYREALLTLMSPSLRRLYHQRLTEHASHLHPADHTYHLVQAGHAEEGIEALLKQGDNAWELADWRDALRYYQEALWLTWSQPGNSQEMRRAAYERIGDVHLLTVTEPEIARGYYEAALALTQNPREIVSLLCRLVETYAGSPRAIQCLEDAARLVAQVQDKALQTWVQFLQAKINPLPSFSSQRTLYRLGHQLLQQHTLPVPLLNHIRLAHLQLAGEFRDLKAIQNHALALKQIPLQSWTAACHHFSLGGAYHNIGYLSDAKFHMEQAARIFNHLGRSDEAYAAYDNWAGDAIYMGEWAQARSLLQEIFPRAMEGQPLGIFQCMCKTWIYDHHPDGPQWARQQLEALSTHLLGKSLEERPWNIDVPLQELGSAERIFRDIGQKEEFKTLLETFVERLQKAGYKNKAIWCFHNSIERPEVMPVDDVKKWRWTAGSKEGGFSIEKGKVILSTAPHMGFIYLTIPRLMKTVLGDFTLQATVHSGIEVLENVVYCRQQAGTGHTAEKAMGGGGLLVLKDPLNNLRLFAHVREPSEVFFEVRENGQRRTLGRGLLKDNSPVCLRLEKKGTSLWAYAANEGCDWYLCGEIDLPNWERVEVGIYGECLTDLYPLVRRAETRFWNIGLKSSATQPRPVAQDDVLYPRPVVEPDSEFPEIIAESRRMQKLLQQVRQIAKIDSPVLLTGETGTGKELMARALHKLGSRSTGPFIPLNCAAIAPDLLESGHGSKKGQIG